MNQYTTAIINWQNIRSSQEEELPEQVKLNIAINNSKYGNLDESRMKPVEKSHAKILLLCRKIFV